MRDFFTTTIFWLHFFVVAFWIGLLFVPEFLLPGKTAFHFYFTVGLVGHQFLWGAAIYPWTKKYRMVCILTTFMQLLRGHPLSTVDNYGHSWTKEFIKRLGWGIPERGATVLTLAIFVISTFQFFFFR